MIVKADERDELLEKLSFTESRPKWQNFFRSTDPLPRCNLPEDNKWLALEELVFDVGFEEGVDNQILWRLEAEDGHPVLRPFRCLKQFATRIPALHALEIDAFDVLDREILRWVNGHYPKTFSEIALTWQDCEVALPLLAARGRLFLDIDVSGEPLRLSYHPQPILGCRFTIDLSRAEETGVSWRVWSYFENKQQESVIDLWDVTQILPVGLLIYDTRLLHYSDRRIYPFVAAMKESGSFYVPKAELGEFLFVSQTWCDGVIFDLPADVSLTAGTGRPAQVLYLYTKNGSMAGGPAGISGKINGFASFRYLDKEFPHTFQENTAITAPYSYLTSQDGLGIEFSHRDQEAERTLLVAMIEKSKCQVDIKRESLLFRREDLLSCIYQLLESGWEIWAEKIRIEILGMAHLDIEPGDDNWFDVSFSTDKGERISTWQLINILKRKSLFIRLGDGRLCVLPEFWYSALSKLENLASLENERWRVHYMHSLGLADACESLGQESSHSKLAEVSGKLRNLSGLKPERAPSGFQAKLRPYQEYGLAWLNFLHDMKFSGCLADDMGLGKTVQVLAFFAGLRQQNNLPLGSLLVAPKSLLHQWQAEARRLAPMLSTVIVGRNELLEIPKLIASADIILASYGFVRHNAALLSKLRFNYIVLDEAQMIKNPNSQTSGAVKQLTADFRLALTGTPIENRVEELLSIFSFLKPSRYLLDRTPLAERGAHLELLIKNLRPLILRRLKSDVLDDLPEKCETLVILPMEKWQANVYQKVRQYYLHQLELRKDEGSFEPHKFFFLEGLLRLRQCACHPGLLQGAAADEDSNKLAYLQARLSELVVCGHKVVVFSQFVKFLRKVEAVVAKMNIPYSYLDGQTQDRETQVKSFQEKAEIKICLVSLQTGGLGLNLTAADYCFILDPWWNPAVERQAVDRLHRIGQKRSVFIYRLISEKSIEEKILLLHDRKRGYADLLGATGGGFLEGLNFEDFRGLFDMEEGSYQA